MGVMSTAWLFGRFGWWVLALPLVGCGREPQCVDVELLALDVTHVRASGRTHGPGWAVGQLDASGVHTPLLELQIDASYYRMRLPTTSAAATRSGRRAGFAAPGTRTTSSSRGPASGSSR